MPKKMLIDATHAEETRVVVVDGNKVEEFDFESQFKRQLAGNIYLAKVTRVEPSLQAAFVDYGGNRHGFLAFSEIHPDYYQIPVADREALIAEEKAYAESLRAAEEEEEAKPKPKRRRRRSKTAAAEAANDDAVATAEVDVPAEGTEAGEAAAEAEAVDDAPKTETEASEAQDLETAAEPEETSEEETSGDIAGMETIDLGEEADAEPIVDASDDAEDAPKADATSKDDRIESVKEDDTDEVRPVRKPRPKRYKIQEVINVRQILLVQVVKEERGNKGAALTTYLSLAGRYCVLMPNTARGGGISRKITNAADRHKLKEIANSMDVPDGAGLIIRTAGSQRTKTEIKRDYEYLQRMWEQIRELTLKSIAPAGIYEEGDLIKRSIRDLYSKEIEEVIVAGDEGYRTAKDFMKMIMPSHAKNVKHYTEQLPLYARYQVEGFLNGMFNPTVQLPSGGYIVIGITEALVAIDVNSGRATKEGSIEQTALKTNLEAADEVARQLRLRDLAGLIVIDFIDMDERRNNNAVEKRFKDRLKTDRARIQVGRISGFGLMEMSRQRLRPGMLEATTQMCAHCHGTGLLRSDDNVSLSILRSLEEEGVRGRSKEVLVKAPISIANFLMNGKREHIADIEARYGMSVRIECDPTLVSPDYNIEKFKTATRVVPEASVVVSAETLMEEGIDLEADVPEEEVAAEESKPKRKRRRRRRRRGGGNTETGQATDGQADEASDGGEVAEQTPDETAKAEASSAPEDAVAEKPKRRRSRKKPVESSEETSETSADPEDASASEKAAEDKPKKRSGRKKVKSEEEAATEPAADASVVETVEEVSPKPKRSRSRKKVEPKEESEESVPAVEEAPKKKRATRKKAPVAVEVTEPEVVASEPTPEPAAEPVPVAEEPAAESKPKRKGWWSLNR